MSSRSAPHPRRGEIWWVDLNPTVGREQAGRRPALVISVDGFNRSAAELVILVPMTSRDKRIRSHIRVPTEETKLELTGFIKCEDVRSVSTDRLHRRMSRVSAATLAAVEEHLRILMGL